MMLKEAGSASRQFMGRFPVYEVWLLLHVWKFGRFNISAMLVMAIY